MKEQPKKLIDSYKRYGSGWLVSRLVSLNVSFAKVDDLLKPKRVKYTDDGEDKDNNEG